MSTYDELMAHLKHHNTKKWLLEGCEHEDANTIRAAVKRTHSYRLNHYLARALSDKREE